MSCIDNLNNASTCTDTHNNNGLSLALNGYMNELPKHALINIPKSEYEKLMRTAERVEIVRRFLEVNAFLSESDLRTILFPETIKEERHETV